MPGLESNYDRLGLPYYSPLLIRDLLIEVTLTMTYAIFDQNDNIMETYIPEIRRFKNHLKLNSNLYRKNEDIVSNIIQITPSYPDLDRKIPFITIKPGAITENNLNTETDNYQFDEGKDPGKFAVFGNMAQTTMVLMCGGQDIPNVSLIAQSVYMAFTQFYRKPVMYVTPTSKLIVRFHPKVNMGQEGRIKISGYYDIFTIPVSISNVFVEYHQNVEKTTLDTMYLEFEDGMTIIKK